MPRLRSARPPRAVPAGAVLVAAAVLLLHPAPAAADVSIRELVQVADDRWHVEGFTEAPACTDPRAIAGWLESTHTGAGIEEPEDPKALGAATGRWEFDYQYAVPRGELMAVVVRCATHPLGKNFITASRAILARDTGAPRPGASAPTTTVSPDTTPTSSRMPVAALAGIVAVLLVAGALAMRSMRRGRTSRESPGDHVACVARTEAATKGLTAGKARVATDARSRGAELARALGELQTQVDAANGGFADLLDQTNAVERFLDDMAEQIAQAQR